MINPSTLNMVDLTISFCIIILCISYVESIDFINPTSPIDCGTSGEDCNLNCTKSSAGCKGTTILYNNANFNLFCANSGSCSPWSIHAHNVINMQLVTNGTFGLYSLHLFIDGNRSDTVNVYCKDAESCGKMELHALSPNLNLNIHCQHARSCYGMFILGIYNLCSFYTFFILVPSLFKLQPIHAICICICFNIYSYEY